MPAGAAEARPGESGVPVAAGVSGSGVGPLWGLFRCHAGDCWEPLPEGATTGRKVLLYVHGWQPGHHKDLAGTGAVVNGVTPRPLAVPAGEGFVSNAELYGQAVDTAAPWREQGYDVLAFCWAPFADEATPAQVEQKIWDDSLVHPWRSSGCSSSSEGSPEGSLGRAFYEAARAPLMECEYLHIVGHSLGCQMVASFVERRLAGGDAVPRRITLLDPYFTNFGKNYLGGAWTGERVRRAMRGAAEAGAAIEQYRSSKVLDNPFSDASDELLLITAYFIMNPAFLKVAGGVKDFQVLAQRHSYAKQAYFRSKGCVQPREVVNGAIVEGAAAGHASASDQCILSMMGGEYHWVQVRGTDSPDPAQHAYERRRGPSNAYLPVRAQAVGA